MKKASIIVLLILFDCILISIVSAQSHKHIKTQNLTSFYPDSLLVKIDKVIADFENALREEEEKMPPLYGNIHAVRMNLQGMKALIRNQFKNANGLQIDFIPQYELAPNGQIKRWVRDSIERYQMAVRNYLTKAGYDLVGWEASALDRVTHELFEQELLKNWKEADSSINIDATNLFIRFASQYMWLDGVLAYWAVNPNAQLIGLEEKSLWRLNIHANEFDVPFSYYVAEFRSYVAMAKMIRAIRENKAKQFIRTVIVMGAWHQSDITFIAKALDIKMKVVNVMENK